MASCSNMQYPQLRKLDFPIIKYPGGVCDALRQHREAVRHLLGSEEPLTRPSCWDPPSSPGLPSIFDFPDPVPPPSPLPALGPAEIEQDDEDDDAELFAGSPDDDDTSIAQSIETDDDDDNEAAETAAVQAGTDPATLALVRELHSTANGLGSSRRGAMAPEIAKPLPSPSATPSPPPQKKRKRPARCIDEHDTPSSGRDTPDDSPTPPPPKKQRKRTENGDLIGTPLPATVQAEVNFISGMATTYTGYPSRNILRKAPQAAGEVSRKSGYLMTVRRGGRLRRWFGDEAVFGWGCGGGWWVSMIGWVEGRGCGLCGVRRGGGYGQANGQISRYLRR